MFVPCDIYECPFAHLEIFLRNYFLSKKLPFLGNFEGFLKFLYVAYDFGSFFDGYKKRPENQWKVKRYPNHQKLLYRWLVTFFLSDHRWNFDFGPFGYFDIFPMLIVSQKPKFKIFQDTRVPIGDFFGSTFCILFHFSKINVCCS